jgi:hypothetical protein
MGYRSNVVNAIAFPSKDKLLSFLTECRLNNVIDKQELDAYEVRVYHEHLYKDFGDSVRAERTFVYVLHAEFEDVKWYESFSDVQQHEAMLELANEKNYPTCFIRIGEETDDVVENINSGYVDGFEFGWWDYEYRVIRGYDIADADTTLTMQDFIKTNRSSDDGQQSETSESQDAVSA